MSMTSETDLLKTNEFLRRRKLRLQQVREQSKDIAKKIRQRAKVEKLRQDLDSKKEKEYIKRQDKLVQRLEQLYAQGVKSIGDSHKKALEETQNEILPEKDDLSKVRGKEAVAELRRKKQERLDEQKKRLDRKLLAREAANEISRDKSSSVANKLLAKSSSSKLTEETDCIASNANAKEALNEDNPKVTSDMATQWDSEELPNEWEPNIPALLLPRDDKESGKDSNIVAESKSDKSKRLDLFALSAEMPSSLRGGLPAVPEDRPSIRPSLNLVSEYLQSRALRLRETDTTGSSKKQSDDLQNIKQTILRSRSSKIEGTIPINAVCHVVDEQVIPVPSWQAESNCEFCSHSITHHNQANKCRQFTVTNSQINEIFSSIRPIERDWQPSPIVRGTSPFRRNKVTPKSSKLTAKGNIATSSSVEANLAKKNSVTMYNHSTRDSRDVPCKDSRFVVRDLQTDEDAYSQALKETTSVNSKSNEHQKKLQEMRNKVAMTKQTVEKEYNDTMSFLKSLPKEKCTKHMKNAHMDERRQRILKVSRQQKLQQEFNKIEKECRKNCENAKPKQVTPEKTQRKSKSPGHLVSDDDFEYRDMQYSWMPVPESDGNLAIHTIPTTLKEGKTGNTVKFSKVDSYHEYRSRHKHTPPTKDTAHDKQPSKRVVETVIIQKDEDETTDCSSISSDTSSVKNLNFDKNINKESDSKTMSEADRIIIYKILDKKEKERRKMKLIDNVAKVLKSMDKEKLNKVGNDNNNNKQVTESSKSENKHAENQTPVDQIDEGVYKVVSEKGENITSLYFSEDQKLPKGQEVVLTEDELKYGRPCYCNKIKSNDLHSDKGTHLHCENSDPSGKRTTCLGCKCGCASKPWPREKGPKTVNTMIQPSAGTSTSSFKTATTDKAHGAMPDGGFIKLIDDDGQEAGKFYIGASGFLRDDAYEVIIQLRKKESTKTENDKEKSLENNVKEKEVVHTIQDMNEGNTLPVNKTDTIIVEETTKKPNIIEKEDVLQSDIETPRNPPKATLHTNIFNESISKVPVEEEQDSSLGVTSISSNDNVLNKEQTKKFADKGVHTPFQLSYAIPDHVPKTDQVHRPATSTYTQTTLDSPNLRPVFIHMSSSTSTAYMSPPEMVLPNILRQDRGFKGEKLTFSDRNPNERCENEKCTRKRCRCHRSKSSGSCRNINSFNKILFPPPNTARNDDDNSDTYDNESEQPIRESRSKKSHRSHHRPGSSGINQCKNHRKKHNIAMNRPSRNIVMRINSGTTSFKNRVNPNSVINKPDLNPTIKNYVNKLLQLNRQGIKAIEVANQECSSVSTPGSSIIEVPRNLKEKKSNIDNKISLEQMKNILKQQILEEYVKESTVNTSAQTLYNNNSRTNLNKLAKKRSVHKVKSLNISKRVLKTKKSQVETKCSFRSTKTNPSTSSPSSMREVKRNNKPEFIPNKPKPRSKSSPTPRQYHNFEQRPKNISSDISDSNSYLKTTKKFVGTKCNSDDSVNHKTHQPQVTSRKNKGFCLPFQKATATSPDSEMDFGQHRDEAAMNHSTQTSQDLDTEINLMKLAENKLQNMEKIADLTEKCTKRLSNLARVLEEVRKNKTLAYSQISTSDTASTSDSELRSNKNANANNTAKISHLPVINVQDKSEHGLSTTLSSDQEKEVKLSDSSEYVPFLTNIPKPAEFKYHTPHMAAVSDNTKSNPLANSNIESTASRRREKPPPALSRIHLKHGQDVVPHELSTVVEVDSPMSLKLKNKSSTNAKCDDTDMSCKTNNDYKEQKEIDKNITTSTNTEHQANPDLLKSNTSIPKQQNKMSSTDTSDDSKSQMMDLKQFNELMLKPFISIQEFAKQCGDIGALDDGSNLEDVPKDDGINDELSSLHSDGSLPDVIAELLKRNVITEPFKFDTVSNVNSTTVSSESTLSVLALSKVRKDKKKSSVAFQNKGAIGNGSETSDSLSISSNPDLENAFKKLGMGWASSTLKKTKERLALSSSSNTSSSSLSQFKLKCLNEQDIPVLVSDSVLSTTTTKPSSKKQQEKRSADTSKNAEQQTSFMNSMTVKEFLTNELAKKITFTNKSNRNDTEDEFVSLFETKMPEEMKHMLQSVREESSHSPQNNRARTSTPVQLFKSMTYHSSSSSNKSNGLFSNADDLSSVKVTSNSIRYHSTSDKDDLTIPNCSLKMRKGASDCSKSE